MKILEINKTDIYYLPKQEGFKKSYIIHNPITPPRALNFYQPVNFKGYDKVDKNTLIDKGYEVVKIGDDGKVRNTSKFLIIDKPEQLSAVSKSADVAERYFVLASDIDMKGVEFTPIGNYTRPFKGNFDGNGYSVKNLTINAQRCDSGFFAFTDGAKISNLNLENININAQNEAGGLVGHASNTEINNCSVEGTISGELNTGGLIGVGRNNKINLVKVSGILQQHKETPNTLFFDTNEEHFVPSHLNSSFGGIVASDEASSISNVYSNVEICAENNCGGIVGTSNYFYSTPTKIKGAWFEGKIQQSDSCGAIIGCGNNVEISQSIAINNRLVGQNQDCRIRDCITKIEDITNANIQNWDKKAWDIHEFSLPRLKCIKEKINPEKIFLDDVNIARMLGLLPDSSTEYHPMEYVEIPLEIKPPKHYDKNTDLVNKIRSSTNKDQLLEWFYMYSDIYNINCLNTDEYDEILLELVKNKNLDINHIYNSEDEYRYGLKESIRCHPLYICSRLGKPFIYRELLKRDDIDLDKPCGFVNYTDTFQVMQYYTDDSSAYVLYTSENPKVQEYLAKNIAVHNKENRKSATTLVNLMNKYYPEIFKYDYDNYMIRIPSKCFPELSCSTEYFYNSNNRPMNNIKDFLRNMDADINYSDSNGNNIANLAALAEDELHALSLYINAQYHKANLTHRNYKGESPIDTLLRTGKNQQVLAELISQIQNPFVTNEYGESAIQLFVKNKNEKAGIAHIEKALNAGLSVNIVDNFGATPLMNAIEQKYNNMAKFLILNGADVNICDNNGQSPLHYACIYCDGITDLDIIYTLINRNANTKLKDETGRTPFDYLSDEIKSIVNMSPEEYASFREQFRNQPEIYSALTPNAVQYNAHTQLLENSNISEENCNIFKAKNISKSMITQNAILTNLINGTNTDTTLQYLKLLLNRDSLPKELQTFEYENSLLHILMQTNSPLTKECIKILCRKDGVNIDAQNQFKETPLMLAAENYLMLNNAKDKLICIDNILTLLDFSPNVNILDDNKQNVLHRICQSDCVILLSKFLELDSNINQKDVLGKNPIEYLSENALNKMRKYYESYALNKKLKLNLTESLKRLL